MNNNKEFAALLAANGFMHIAHKRLNAPTDTHAWFTRRAMGDLPASSIISPTEHNIIASCKRSKLALGGIARLRAMRAVKDKAFASYLAEFIVNTPECRGFRFVYSSERGWREVKASDPSMIVFVNVVGVVFTNAELLPASF